MQHILDLVRQALAEPLGLAVTLESEEAARRLRRRYYRWRILELRNPRVDSEDLLDLSALVRLQADGRASVLFARRARLTTDRRYRVIDSRPIVREDVPHSIGARWAVRPPLAGVTPASEILPASARSTADLIADLKRARGRR